MNNIKNPIILLVLPLFFAGCSWVDNTVYSSVDEMVAEHKNNVILIAPSQLNELIAAQTPGLKIIDVREPDEYSAGHIPGAVNIPRGILEFSTQLTNRREKIYLYSNKQNRSALAAGNLNLLKFGNVAVLDGGLEAWKSNYPDKIEEGSGSVSEAAPAKKAASGGCGD